MSNINNQNLKRKNDDSIESNINKKIKKNDLIDLFDVKGVKIFLREYNLQKKDKQFVLQGENYREYYSEDLSSLDLEEGSDLENLDLSSVEFFLQEEIIDKIRQVLKKKIEIIKEILIKNGIEIFGDFEKFDKTKLKNFLNQNVSHFNLFTVISIINEINFSFENHIIYYIFYKVENYESLYSEEISDLYLFYKNIIIQMYELNQDNFFCQVGKFFNHHKNIINTDNERLSDIIFSDRGFVSFKNIKYIKEKYMNDIQSSDLKKNVHETKIQNNQANLDQNNLQNKSNLEENNSSKIQIKNIDDLSKLSQKNL
jgi:hypothetical protein